MARGFSPVVGAWGASNRNGKFGLVWLNIYCKRCVPQNPTDFATSFSPFMAIGNRISYQNSYDVPLCVEI